MSATKVDMLKVAQMFDAGWRVLLYKDGMGSYSVQATHPDPAMVKRTRARLEAGMAENKQFLQMMRMPAAEAVEEQDFDGGYVITDDFTPEQALTRMAYKVFGEII